MNIYFLVEGKTERKVYPKWISYFLPNLTRINSPNEANENNYYLISGGGYPSILDNHLVDAAHDVTSCGNYNLFVIALDSDGADSRSKAEEVFAFVNKNNINFGECELIVMPQVVCMETWFLGNRRIFPRNPKTPEFGQLARHYNTSVDDPENMKKPLDFDGTISGFHYKYLKSMLADRNISYSKSHPAVVTEPYYIKELEARISNDLACMTSMKSLFKLFYDLRQFLRLDLDMETSKDQVS